MLSVFWTWLLTVYAGNMARKWPGTQTVGLSKFVPVLLTLCSLACNLTTSVRTPEPASYWGGITILGQAEQTHAPALWVEPGYAITTWVGADDAGIHHDFRLVTTEVSPIVVLPLPPVRPYAQQLAPALGGSIHLLWLDADAEGETRLFTALIAADGVVERGPTSVSDRHTFRYAVIPNGDGSLWVLWVGEPVAEPVLYAQYMDSLSRPRQPLRLLSDADWPALSWISSGIDLYWMQASTGQINRGSFADGSLTNMQVVSSGIALASGDRLSGLNAASDHAHRYVFWNLTRANGQFETWIAANRIGDSTWGPPQRLGIEWTTKSFVETGYNGGWAFPARLGERWLSWAAPVTGQLETLPVAALQGRNLVLLFLRAGELVGYQNITPVTNLIGPPILLTDRDLHLYLAWAEPTPAGYANLKLTMTAYYPTGLNTTR
jgi:hypothetical protein